jgi:DNA-directed RNA polymerase specialized sigma24 family protein
MTSGIIDESAIAEALRLGEPGEAIKRLLRFQGLGIWHGDLSEMRGDVPRSPAPVEPSATSAEAQEMTRRMRMVRHVRQALDRLPPKPREALYLRYFKWLPIEEVADELCVPTPSAEELLREALDRVTAIYVETADERDDL